MLCYAICHIIIPSKRERSTKKLHSFDLSTREGDSNGIGGIHSMIQTYFGPKNMKRVKYEEEKILKLLFILLQKVFLCNLI